MTGTFLAAWVGFPLLLGALSLGVGLFVRRLAGGGPNAVLLLPVGFAGIVVVCACFTTLQATARLATWVVVALAVLGVVFERRRLRWNPGVIVTWAAAASAGVFAVIAAPVVLLGSPSWTGYAHIVDTAFEFDLGAQLPTSGRTFTNFADSSFHELTNKLLHIGYPGGAPSTLGSLVRLVGIDQAWAYQTFLAFTAAVGALGVYALLHGVVRPKPMRALASFIALQANLLLGYTMAGGVKEISSAAMLLVCAGLLADRPMRAQGGRAQFPLAVVVAAAFADYNLTISPWLGVLILGAFLASVIPRGGRKRTLLTWVEWAAVTAALSVPTIRAAVQLAPTATGAGPVDLGNLAAPVSHWSALGVWVSKDYRFPLAISGNASMTNVLIVVSAALALLGFAAAVIRRQWIVVCIGAAGVIATVYVAKRYGPWIQFKAQCVTAPIALTLAFCGAWELLRRRWTALVGVLSLTALASGVLYGSALIYHNTSLAPYSRLHDIEQIGHRFAGSGPTLYPDFEEYADYFLRSMRATTPVDPPNSYLALRPGVAGSSQLFTIDLNQFTLGYVQSYRMIVQRRRPSASRPPTNWDLVYRTRYSNVWRRTRPASSVFGFFPLSQLPHERTRAFCAGVLSSLRRAGGQAAMAYAPAPLIVGLTPRRATFISPDLVPLPDGSFAAHGPGRVSGSVIIREAGRYEVWLGGTFGRPVTVLVDGRRVGVSGYQESYPGQSTPVAVLDVTAGAHTVEMRRGGGGLAPGAGDGVDGVNRTIGPLQLVREGTDGGTVRYVSAAHAAAICRAPIPMEWAEVVRAPGVA